MTNFKSKNTGYLYRVEGGRVYLWWGFDKDKETCWDSNKRNWDKQAWPSEAILKSDDRFIYV